MEHTKPSVLITGCTPGGIGHALAVEFHRRGCHVIATARREAVLEDLGAMGMSVVALDVTSKESIASCKARVEQLTGGRLDILVNNAGRGCTVPSLDVDIDEARSTFETNVFGPMMMVQGFISLLISARGLIVNISSCSAEVPYIFAGVYAGSKGALNSYSRVLRQELKPFNVRVMVSMTGTVRSNIANLSDRPLPSSSLYQPAADYYSWRLTYSQKTSTMPNQEFAKKLVTQALKGEGYLGGLIGGSPEWFWGGGMSYLLWISTFMPRWLSESLVARMLQVPKMVRKIREARENKF